MAKRGRPAKKIEDVFPPNWKDVIFQMAAQGDSDVAIRAHFLKLNGMSAVAIMGMWHELKKRETDFANTLQVAKQLCQAWWEEQSKKRLYHPKEMVFETGSWYANMKNRFGWRDKTEVEHDLSDRFMEKYNALSTEQLKEKISAIIGNKA